MKAEDVVKLVKKQITDVKIPNERRVFATVDKKNYKETLLTLKSNDITHLSTITGVDTGEQIVVIYHLDCGDRVMLSLKVPLPKNDPRLQTVTDVFPGAILYERDLMDMLGVKVEGHPDPRRIFLPEDWPAGKYPLRKEEAPKKEEAKK